MIVRGLWLFLRFWQFIFAVSVQLLLQCQRAGLRWPGRFQLGGNCSGSRKGGGNLAASSLSVFLHKNQRQRERSLRHWSYRWQDNICATRHMPTSLHHHACVLHNFLCPRSRSTTPTLPLTRSSTLDSLATLSTRPSAAKLA